VDPVNIARAKAQLSELVERAERGEEVIIARGNKPVVRLVPLRKRGKRKPGAAKGQIWMAPDFDKTPDEFKDYLV